MEKSEIFQDLKNNILKPLLVENRISIGINVNNYSRKDNAQIPLDLQLKIDEVYRKLEEIATQYGVSTLTIDKMIEDADYETKDVASKKYKDKADNQLMKVQGIVNQIEKELEETEKTDEKENELRLKEEMNSENENSGIKTSIVRNLNDNIRKIRQEMQKTGQERFLNPRKLENMQEEIEDTLRKLQVGDKIDEILQIEDKYMMERIINELQKYTEYTNQTPHEKFAEKYKHEVPPLDLRENVEDIQEEKEYKDRLPDNVIE